MPVLEQLAAEYPDVSFVAVAGRSDPQRSAEVAEQLGLDRVAWGYDESLWERYEVRGQPTAFLISPGRELHAGPWYRVGDDAAIRAGVEELIASSG